MALRPAKFTAIISTTPSLQPIMPSESPFDTLPPELRNEIYHLVLPNHTTIKILTKSGSRRRSESFEHPLLLVNKQIRAEAMPMFYGRNYISILAPFSGLRATIDWLSSVVAVCGPEPFAKFRLGLGPTEAEYKSSTTLLPLEKVLFLQRLPLLWPLVLFVSKTGLRVDYDPSSKKGHFVDPDLFHSWHPYGVYNPTMLKKNDLTFNVTAIKEMIELGQSAKKGGWDRERLRDMFERWVEWKQEHPKTRAWLHQRTYEMTWRSKPELVPLNGIRILTDDVTGHRSSKIAKK